MLVLKWCNETDLEAKLQSHSNISWRWLWLAAANCTNVCPKACDAVKAGQEISGRVAAASFIFITIGIIV